MIGVGSVFGGLYHLSPSIACVSTTSFDISHQCLGHPNLKNLCLLVPSLSTLKSLQCKSCQLRKHVHNSNSPRVNKFAMSPFVLVHRYLGAWSSMINFRILLFYYFCWWLSSLFLGLLNENHSDVFCLSKFFTWNY